MAIAKWIISTVFLLVGAGIVFGFIGGIVFGKGHKGHE
jgi:nitrogen fixation-related uncharacterized protein